jgi:hypothetical protein
MEISIYLFIAKWISAEQEISNYIQNINYVWSEVDNYFTIGLNNIKLDIFEFYYKTNYPPEVVDILSNTFTFIIYNITILIYVIKFKNCDGNMVEVQLQCAYDGALMTEETYAMHIHMDKSDDNFYDKIQTLIIVYNNDTMKFYNYYII